MRNQINWTKLSLGGQDWLVLATERGVCRIAFPHEGLDSWRAWMNRVAPDVEPIENAAAVAATGVIERLQAYFHGERVTFQDVPLDLIGTPFQQQVWTALGQVPFGETRTYGDIAKAVGRPHAVRAVGAANGANPVPVLLPCHRIVGANRKLTGFRGGLGMKRKLLELEQVEGVEDGGHARFRF